MTVNDKPNEHEIIAMLILLDSFLSYPSFETFETLMSKYHIERRGGMEFENWCWAINSVHCVDCKRLTRNSRLFAVCSLRRSRHYDGFKALWDDNQGEIVIMLTQFREFTLELFPDLAVGERSTP